MVVGTAGRCRGDPVEGVIPIPVPFQCIVSVGGAPLRFRDVAIIQGRATMGHCIVIDAKGKEVYAFSPVSVTFCKARIAKNVKERTSKIVLTRPRAKSSIVLLPLSGPPTVRPSVPVLPP